MNPLPEAAHIALAATTALAAFTDIRAREIPNWLSAAGIVAGIAIHVSYSGLSGLGYSLLGFGLALLIYVPLFAIRAMGGGDVKLMAAVGAIAGAKNWFNIFLLTCLASGAIAVCFLLWRGGLGKAFRNAGFIVGEVASGRAPHKSRPDLSVDSPSAITLPHAAAISIGTLAFLLLVRNGPLVP
jgi:prepilin peptidase CpaA